MHMRGMPEVLKPSKTARDEDLAKRLWEVSERLTGVRFPLALAAPTTTSRAA
jgi:hypothetical protein